MGLDVVVSTCISRDLELWKYSCPRITQHIKSKKYVAIVPRPELDIFKLISPTSYEIVSEDDVISGVTLATVRDRLPDVLFERAGWYFQQLLKIQYLRSMSPGEVGVIWDADTIPLKALRFWDNSGRLILRTGVHKPEIHPPYFGLIRDVLGLGQVGNASFISQCFPARFEWVNDFCCEIESRSGVVWWEAVLAHISKNPSYCAFSEYESLGTFVAHNYPDAITLQKGRYYRPYNALFSLSELDSEGSRSLIKNQHYEYVAYDAYEKRRVTGLNIGCGRSRIITAVDGGICLNIDRQSSTATDMIADLELGLPFQDMQFNHIIAHNILEHVEDVIHCVTELDRLLAPGGILQIEVPHVGSYNYGTDVTHRRGLTFSSFSFLNKSGSYLYPEGNGPFNYRLISFNKENIVDGDLIREYADEIPARGTYAEWLRRVQGFEIPGTFGFIFQKL